MWSPEKVSSVIEKIRGLPGRLSGFLQRLYGRAEIADDNTKPDIVVGGALPEISKRPLQEKVRRVSVIGYKGKRSYIKVIDLSITGEGPQHDDESPVDPETLLREIKQLAAYTKDPKSLLRGSRRYRH